MVWTSSVYISLELSVFNCKRLTISGRNCHCSVLSCSFWFCCVDVSVSRQMLVTGDNVGQLLLLSLDGQKVIILPRFVPFSLLMKVFPLPSSVLILRHRCHFFYISCVVIDFQRQVAQSQSDPRRVQFTLWLVVGHSFGRPHGQTLGSKKHQGQEKFPPWPSSRKRRQLR